MARLTVTCTRKDNGAETKHSRYVPAHQVDFCKARRPHGRRVEGHDRVWTWTWEEAASES